MGVGTPADLLASVRAGIDLFDCVLPTRNGRMGHAYTSAGEVVIKHERFKEDLSPLDPACDCPVCRAPHPRLPAKSLRAEGFLRAHAPLHPQRLFLPGVDEDDPRRDPHGNARCLEGAAPEKDR